jgi:hypothetical protein
LEKHVDVAPLIEFPKQQMAFDFCDSIALNTNVFAYQPKSLLQHNAALRYVVATLDDFWNKYQRIDVDQRHFYEVIREKTVCSKLFLFNNIYFYDINDIVLCVVELYFDVEFSKTLNPNHDGDTMMKHFKTILLRLINRKFNVDVKLSDLIDLESSSTTKFSRHLIVGSKQLAFRDNVSMIE